MGPRARSEPCLAARRCAHRGLPDVRQRVEPIGQAAARRALAQGVAACTHCRPDRELGVAGVVRRAREHRPPGQWHLGSPGG
ncbi:DUF6233 domain-containing protein [Streptomyces sp. BBFR109]|uniref:DUF6233 domain-containing protein n=1 Tax=Streptomyces sp. BBFR109 TaxID=3448172 RepID=UPI003F762AF9